MVLKSEAWSEKTSKYKAIGEIANFRRGSFPQPYDRPEWYGGRNSYPFVQVADIDADMKLVDKTKKRISTFAQAYSVFVPKGTVIISLQGTVGRVALTQYDSYVDRTVAIFQNLNPEVNKHYFMYQLQSVFDVEKKSAKGSTIKTITKEEFTEFLLPIPDIDEQKAIANVLSDFDEHIDNLTELIEKKKAIREGALEDLISGRTRVDGFDEEWIKVTFDEVIIPKARIGWQGLKKEEYLTSGYSYLIGGVDFDDGTINLDTISYVTRERFEMDSNIQVESNNVLVTKDGTIGKVALVPVIDKPATLNSGVFVFKTKESLIPTFLYRVLLSSVFRKFIDTLSAGSTIKHLYQKDLKKFSFFMPKNLDEQKAISSILMDIDDEIKDLESEKDKMNQIREGAMNDLLTGRVRLK